MAYGGGYYADGEGYSETETSGEAAGEGGADWFPLESGITGSPEVDVPPELIIFTPETPMTPIVPISPVTPSVPEPSTLMLLFSGSGLLLFRGRKSIAISS